MANKKDIKKNKNQKINEETYAIIKKMIDSGSFSTVQIQRIMNISSATMHYVKYTNSLEEYRALILAHSRLAKQRAAERKQKEDEAREVYEAALEEAKTEEAKEEEEKVEAPVKQEIQPNFNEVLLEQIVEELKEINKKLAQAEILKQVEEEEDRAPRRSFFGIGKPF